MVSKGSKIILFYSPQGGSGKSTMAVNLSVFSSLFGNKTLLVDMATFGCINLIFQIPNKVTRGISSILNNFDLMEDISNNKDFIGSLQKSIIKSTLNEKLHILTSGDPIKMESLDDSRTLKLLDVLRSFNYDVIIIDTSSELSIRNLIMLDEANIIIIPAEQDIACGWKILLFKEVIEKLKIDQSKIKIAFNKCHFSNGFNNFEVENELGFPIIFNLPRFDKAYQSYINKGITINRIKNRKVQKAFYSLSKSCLELIKMDLGAKK